MGPNIVPQVGLQNLMDAAIGHASIGFNGAKVGLFTNDVAPNNHTVASDLTDATFAGSTPATITWGTPYLNSNGYPEVNSQLVSKITDGVIDETAYGIKVVDGADPTALRLAARLDAPKVMNDAGAQLDFVVRLTLSPEGFGASIQVSE